MREWKTRPSRQTPGLLIGGTPGWYRLYAVLPEGRKTLVLDEPKINTFRLVRDAEAAALRLADVAPWGDPEALAALAKLSIAESRALRVRIVEGLTGRTIEELREAEAEHREAQQRHYDGTGARDALDEAIRGAGHEPTWKKKGLRTYWATCPCGAEFRSSYDSMSGGFRQRGLNGTCTREVVAA